MLNTTVCALPMPPSSRRHLISNNYHLRPFPVDKAIDLMDEASSPSKVAALPEVRAALLQFQREFAKNPPGNVGGAVLDGRDIGTVVCPQADIKLFVTAEPEERAQRRFKELNLRHPQLTLEKVLADIVQRDLRDSSRAVAPTLPAADAFLLDTTRLSPVDVLERATFIVQEKFLKATDSLL